MRLNANAAHQILNLGIGAIATAEVVLRATGCTESFTGSLECSASILPPQYSAGAIVALTIAKFAINIGRDGFGGLFLPQPPVTRRK